MWSAAVYHGVSLVSTVTSLRLAHIPVLVVTGSGGLIAMCYVLATTAGHARVLLPMISDCFRRAPESYVAGWGMCSIACLGLVLSVLATAGYLKRFKAATPLDAWLQTATACLGLLACAGFVAAGLVTERDDNFVHSSGALVGFFGYYLYAISLTAALYRGQAAGAATRASIVCKAACLALGLLAVLAYCCLVANGALKDGVDGDEAVALCEWMCVIVIGLFILTFRLEFRNDLRLIDVWPAAAKILGACSIVGARREPLLATDPVESA
mmetsp:Transcript_106995/g.284693  ORF Transcript_106995/g.284693 Transcript_106995/m.284693 type:complete len:269 (-) Transcript_106995:176-982(-)